jgi:hypothetical protein
MDTIRKMMGKKITANMAKYKMPKPYQRPTLKRQKASIGGKSMSEKRMNIREGRKAKKDDELYNVKKQFMKNLNVSSKRPKKLEKPPVFGNNKVAVTTK